MAGKIQRQKLAKGGSRGRYGVSGLSAFRSKSRPARRAPIARNRGADYEKFVELRAEVDALSAEARGVALVHDWADERASRLADYTELIARCEHGLGRQVPAWDAYEEFLSLELGRAAPGGVAAPG